MPCTTMIKELIQYKGNTHLFGGQMVTCGYLQLLWLLEKERNYKKNILIYIYL